MSKCNGEFGELDVLASCKTLPADRVRLLESAPAFMKIFRHMQVLVNNGDCRMLMQSSQTDNAAYLLESGKCRELGTAHEEALQPPNSQIYSPPLDQSREMLHCG